MSNLVPIRSILLKLQAVKQWPRFEPHCRRTSCLYLWPVNFGIHAFVAVKSRRQYTSDQGRSDGVGGISVYIPPNQYLKFFMWLFCLLDPFIPTQIKFLATPLQVTQSYIVDVFLISSNKTVVGTKRL